MNRNHLVLGLLILVFDGQPAVAQATLPPWTEVRFALAGNAFVEGRLVRGDTATLTIRTAGGELVTVHRTDILLMTATTSSTLDQAFPTGLVAGVLSAVVFATYSARCSGPNACGPSASTAFAGGALGLTFGTLIAGALAAPTRAWRAVTPTVRVEGNPSGITAPELCQLLPSVKADRGVSTGGSRTQGLAVTLLCYRGFSIGGEQGTPRRLSDDRFTVTNFDQGYTTSSYAHWHNASFVGGFAEIPLGRVLNPRIIVSAGRYRREDRWATVTATYNYPSTTVVTAGATTWSNHLGGGLGVSVSMPMMQHVSVGLDARTHYLAGAGGGTIGTLAATIRVR